MLEFGLIWCQLRLHSVFRRGKRGCGCSRTGESGNYIDMCFPFGRNWIFTCMYAYIYTRKYSVYIYIYTEYLRACIHTRARVNIYIYIHVNIQYIYLRVYSVYMYIHKHKFSVYIYIYKHTHKLQKFYQKDKHVLLGKFHSSKIICFTCNNNVIPRPSIHPSINLPAFIY